MAADTLSIEQFETVFEQRTASWCLLAKFAGESPERSSFLRWKFCRINQNLPVKTCLLVERLLAGLADAGLEFFEPTGPSNQPRVFGEGSFNKKIITSLVWRVSASEDTSFCKFYGVKFMKVISLKTRFSAAFFEKNIFTKESLVKIFH